MAAKKGIVKGHTCGREQIWLTNVKYLCLSPNISLAFVFCLDIHVCTIHVCTISKGFGINKGKEIYLPHKEYLSGHR